MGSGLRSTRLGIVALCALVALTSCSSSGGTKKSGGDTTPDALSAKLSSAVDELTSAHLSASSDFAGQKVKGNGVVELAQGKIAGGDVSQVLPGGLGSIRVVRADGKTYAKLPPGLANTTKPWLLIGGSSKNPVVAQLATLINTLLDVAAPGSLPEFAKASTKIENKGGVTVAGVATTHYVLSVDPAKLPSALSASVGSGSTIPLDLYLDSSGRPAQVSGTFTLVGQKITPTIQLSAFNQPVTITPPPAAQVGTG